MCKRCRVHPNCRFHSRSVNFCVGSSCSIVCSSFTALSFPFVSATIRSLFVRNFARFFTPPYDHGIRRFSFPDVVSNILLFVPLRFSVDRRTILLTAAKSLLESSIRWRSSGTFGRSNNRIRSNVFTGANCIDPGRLMQRTRISHWRCRRLSPIPRFSRQFWLSTVASSYNNGPLSFSSPCSCSHRLPMLTILST